MDKQTDFHSFLDRDSLVIELAETIAGLLNEGIAQNGQASLALSGGSTPIALFKKLSCIDLPWQAITVSLVDERWVATSDADSNEHLVQTHLLQNRAATANFIGMKNPANTATEGEEECNRQLQKSPRPFDVLLLGMGQDGHTASLFPGAAKLPGATDMDSGKLCMSIAPVNAPHERMTLTLPAILDSKRIFLHITGEDKKKVLEQAFAPGSAEAMPIRFILQQQPQKKRMQFSIYWAP